MTALVASLFLGVYVLLPVLLFDKTLAFFVPAKKFSRSRTEELAFGMVVILAPILLSFVLSHTTWLVGHYPLALNEAQDRSKGDDYKRAIMALQSDHFLEANQNAVWEAVEHIGKRQGRFLFWMYGFLLLELTTLIFLLRKYGAWQKNRFYRWFSTPLFKRVSPWHILFTTYTFSPKHPPQIEVDVLSSGELYTGSMGPEHYLTNTDGTLNGLLLTETRRFRRKDLEGDRQAGIQKPRSAYWTPIAGDGQFYIPFNTIANINIRYKLPTEQLKSELAATVKQNQEIVEALKLDGLAGLEITFDDAPQPEDAGSKEPSLDQP